MRQGFARLKFKFSYNFGIFRRDWDMEMDSGKFYHREEEEDGGHRVKSKLFSCVLNKSQ
jgi:hypothetical protein